MAQTLGIEKGMETKVLLNKRDMMIYQNQKGAERMKNQKGFTLIELVVVIVILGILAAVAVPKFVDMQVDARQSAVSGMLGALQGASSLAHAEALVNGQTGATGTIEMEGTTIDLVWGWPAAISTANENISGALNFDGFTFTDAPDAASDALFDLDADATPTDCRVRYTQASESGGVVTAPDIEADDACL